MSDLASYSFGIFQAIDILQLYNRRYNQWKGFLVKLLCFAFGSLVVSICFADKRIFSTVQFRQIHPTTIRSLDGTLKPDRYSCMRICHFLHLALLLSTLNSQMRCHQSTPSELDQTNVGLLRSKGSTGKQFPRNWPRNYLSLDRGLRRGPHHCLAQDFCNGFLRFPKIVGGPWICNTLYSSLRLRTILQHMCLHKKNL